MSTPLRPGPPMNNSTHSPSAGGNPSGALSPQQNSVGSLRSPATGDPPGQGRDILLLDPFPLVPPQPSLSYLSYNWVHVLYGTFCIYKNPFNIFVP